MQQAITAAAAIEFTQTFYESLADGLPVDAAMSEARKAISFALTNTVEWGTPVLYSRASDGHLFTVTTPATTGATENQTAPQTRDANLLGRGKGDAQMQEAGQVDPTPVAPPPVQLRTPQAGKERTLRAAGVDFPFVYVPTSPFQMGSNDYDDEKPIHTMLIKAFWLGKTPVTNAQFRPFVEGGGYTDQTFWTAAGWQWRIRRKIRQPRHWEDNQWSTPQQPVIGVSWFEATAYTNWLVQSTGQSIRLPTEAEWEKAARGLDGRTYPWGNAAPDQSRCNFADHEGKTTLVDNYPAGVSPYGALDMAGNVWEWIGTHWVENYVNYANAVSDEEGGNGLRSLRGGSWGHPAPNLRAANRRKYEPDRQSYHVGFRVVLLSNL